MSTVHGGNDDDDDDDGCGSDFDDHLFGHGHHGEHHDEGHGQHGGWNDHHDDDDDDDDDDHGSHGNGNHGGGKPHDTFVFGNGSGSGVISDFDTNEDMVQIKKGLNGIKTAADVLGHAKQVGSDVVIDLGKGTKITLKNVSLDDLKHEPGNHFDIH